MLHDVLKQAKQCGGEGDMGETGLLSFGCVVVTVGIHAVLDGQQGLASALLLESAVRDCFEDAM